MLDGEEAKQEAMEYETLLFEEDEGVAIVTLVKPPPEKNKTGQMRLELRECCKRLGTNAEARVLVVTGEVLDAFSMQKTMSEMGRGRVASISVAEPIATVEMPVLAGIRGDVQGPGLEMTLACDIRIATDAAHFGFPHIKEGLIPWDGGTQRLSRVVGKAKAMELILTGEVIDAEEAYRIGLVTKVVSPKELMPVTMEMAREMASKGPIALRYAKEAIHKGMDLTLEQGLRLEADLYFLLHTTKDRTEGIKAFREKRTPAFEGS